MVFQFQFGVPDAPHTMLHILAAAFFGSLVAAATVAFLTQWWTERRERRNRRHDLRLKLYMEIIALVEVNELALAEKGAGGCIPPAEIQAKRIGARHRLKLLGTQSALDAYEKYNRLVRKALEESVGSRPANDEICSAREHLIDVMASVAQDDWPRREKNVQLDRSS